MPISAKPKKASPDDFIAAGGSVAAPARVLEGASPPAHPLKFPRDRVLLERLDGARRATPVKLPRNTWILQAIAEKLEREGF
ncbi:MAG: hypothetical protein Q8M31_23695 [Beijerinckiaceae bacterium]|nr:hypothetical protein [Beijerinckiaceae bacterium]